jgi:oxaloacetate decarboxylase alpha subunit
MISNLEFQMKQAGVEGRLEEVLEETERVRADLGYPIMVTPLSQFVGSQAAINVIVGERYKQVTDKVIEYALGWHGGQEALDAMDDDVRDLILDRPRAREIADRKVEVATLADLRRKYGESISDEDLILRSIVGDDAVDVVGSADEPRVHVASERPLIQLIDELVNRDRHRSIAIRRPGFALTIERGSLDQPEIPTV